MNMADSNDKKIMLKNLIWDYDFEPDDLQELLNGSKNSIGHYSKEMIFQKLLESYSWFTLLSIFPPEQMLKILNSLNLNKLRTKSLVKNYEYIKSRLHQSLQSAV